MPVTPLPAVQLFDPAAGYEVTHGRLPHWSQAAAVAFVTWRTSDSLPAGVVARLVADRHAWLSARGIDPADPGWERRLAAQLEVARDDRRQQAARWERALDRGLGACPLRTPACSAVVADSLRHFDGSRYRLFDFVVMPNHVHVLAAFHAPDALRAQAEGWKQYTARRLNAQLGRRGRLWQDECFDHLARSPDQFERLRNYVADNPRRAGLRPGEFAHYSVDLPGSPARQPLPEPHAERAGHTPDPTP